jgi:hypothetical protein
MDLKVLSAAIFCLAYKAVNVVRIFIRNQIKYYKM